MYLINHVDVESYNKMRLSVGWDKKSYSQARKALSNSIVTAAVEDNIVVGFGRIFWDGGMIAYMADIMVDPRYQKRGIGRDIVKHLVRMLKEKASPHEDVKLILVARDDVTKFYEKMGFSYSTNDIVMFSSC